MKCTLSDEQIVSRLDILERMMATDDPKDLPAINRIFQLLIDEQVSRDLADQTDSVKYVRQR